MIRDDGLVYFKVHQLREIINLIWSRCSTPFQPLVFSVWQRGAAKTELAADASPVPTPFQILVLNQRNLKARGVLQHDCSEIVVLVRY